MKPVFAAKSLTRTRKLKNGRIEMTLSDRTGNATTITLGKDLVSALVDALGTQAQAGGDAELTKKPKSFAVGSGNHESVVLLRFEDDAPYGLAPQDAAELAHALLEQSEEVERRPEPLLH